MIVGHVHGSAFMTTESIVRVLFCLCMYVHVYVCYSFGSAFMTTESIVCYFACVCMYMYMSAVVLVSLMQVRHAMCMHWSAIPHTIQCQLGVTEHGLIDCIICEPGQSLL